MEDTDGVRGARLRELGVVRILIQSPFSTGLRARHQCDRFLETLGEMAADISSEEAVQIPTHLLERGRDYLDAFRLPRGHSLVLVHPGSGSIHKCHEPRGLAVLIERLQEEGMCPLVLEGPADHDAVNHVLHFLNTPPPVLRDLDLPQLAGVLRHVTFYIGHDSGVTHLSTLLGVRTIALFGPTNHHRWAPRGSHVTILRGATCRCESWDAVRECTERPCLNVTIEELYAASKLVMKEECANPRNST
ncbi:MAG: glycosyltransferase family 9 protein [Nitrospira sp.]